MSGLPTTPRREHQHRPPGRDQRDALADDGRAQAGPLFDLDVGDGVEGVVERPFRKSKGDLVRAGRQPAGGSLPIVDDQRVGLDAAGAGRARRNGHPGPHQRVRRRRAAGEHDLGPAESQVRQRQVDVASGGVHRQRRLEARTAEAGGGERGQARPSAAPWPTRQRAPRRFNPLNKSILSLLDDGAKTDRRGAPVERHRSFGAGAVGLLRVVLAARSGWTPQASTCSGSAPMGRSACGALGRSLVTHVTSEKDIGRGVVLLEVVLRRRRRGLLPDAGRALPGLRRRQGVCAGHRSPETRLRLEVGGGVRRDGRRLRDVESARRATGS